MEERRSARIGTVSGLALLLGGTAIAAVAGGAQSVFATVMLGLLAAGMGHSLVVEVRRQARRGSPGGWATPDTVNTALLATWSIAALGAASLAVIPGPVRAVGLLLSIGYALSCAYFVNQRRRAVHRTTTEPEAIPGISDPIRPGATGADPENRPPVNPPGEPKIERTSRPATANTRVLRPATPPTKAAQPPTPADPGAGAGGGAGAGQPPTADHERAA